MAQRRFPSTRQPSMPPGVAGRFWVALFMITIARRDDYFWTSDAISAPYDLNPQWEKWTNRQAQVIVCVQGVDNYGT
jgi:hypothetical protein